MSAQHRTRTVPRTLGALVALVVLSLLAGSAQAADACKKVSGKFTLAAVTGSECLSSVGVCAVGEWGGGISGTSTFTGTSVVPTADTATTGVVLLTGDAAFTLKDATLLTKDAIVLRTTGAGDFAEVDTVVGGTGGYAGATGVLRAEGRFTAEAGGGGEYAGELCTIP